MAKYTLIVDKDLIEELEENFGDELIENCESLNHCIVYMERADKQVYSDCYIREYQANEVVHEGETYVNRFIEIMSFPERFRVDSRWYLVEEKKKGKDDG